MKTRSVGSFGGMINSAEVTVKRESELKFAIKKFKIRHLGSDSWMMNRSTNNYFEEKRRLKGVIGKLKVCGIWWRETLRFGQNQGKRRRLKELVNRINNKLHSANVGELNESLLNFCLYSESARTNVPVIVNFHGYLGRRPATMILRPEVASQMMPQQIKRDCAAGESKAI